MYSKQYCAWPTDPSSEHSIIIGGGPCLDPIILNLLNSLKRQLQAIDWIVSTKLVICSKCCKVPFVVTGHITSPDGICKLTEVQTVGSYQIRSFTSLCDLFNKMSCACKIYNSNLIECKSIGPYAQNNLSRCLKLDLV